MGEKSTIFDRVLGKFILSKANEKNLVRPVAQGLITAHTLGTDTNKPLDALREPVGSLIRDEARKVFKAANNLKLNVGQVDITAAGTANRIQSVAEIVDKKVSGKIHHNLPKVKARRILQEIQKEIIMKAGWDKLED